METISLQDVILRYSFLKKGQWQRDSQILLWSIPCPYFGQAHNLETAKQSPFRALRQVKTQTEPTGTKKPQSLGKAISTLQVCK